MESIAAQTGKSFGMDTDAFRERCRGGTVSRARKTFAYIAARQFGAPIGSIAGYLGVGPAAVSFMIQGGRRITAGRPIVI